MHPDLVKIAKAADGLLFTSESDFPLLAFELREGATIPQLITLSGAAASVPVENQDPEYFFRNMIRVFPGEGNEAEVRARRFKALLQVLSELLTDTKVYRVGTAPVNAFITGKLKSGSWGGLRTKQVET